MAQDGAREHAAWMELAAMASKETDPERLKRIIEALCRALEERETILPDGSQAKPMRCNPPERGWRKTLTENLDDLP
ncbi:MAG: hypothetical protein WBM11_18000 [Terriglobales bacterium]